MAEPAENARHADRTLVLIPARLGSTRLPDKPLADIGGVPMIVHVMRRAEEAGLGRVVVAGDDPSIIEAVQAHGGEAVMTRADHESGSDRIFEAAGVKKQPHRLALPAGSDNIGYPQNQQR